MLVLKRDRGESIRIGDDIVITIADAYHSGYGIICVTLGIDAPGWPESERTKKLMKGDSFRIGDNIVIQFVSTRNFQYDKIHVAVGIDAPANYDVYRDEIYQEILEERQNQRGVEPWIKEKPLKQFIPWKKPQKHLMRNETT
ncbi:MAG: carbon storage regulator [Planctomycetaceae bacterium]|jgi:carbon storage regulator CsrA|nr:carbon storage regulator [Planctomycetaceae bacterium]